MATTTRDTRIAERTEFAVTVLRNVPHATTQEIDDCLRIARRFHSRNEASCNYGLTPRQEANDQRDTERVRAIAERWGVSVRVNGDPRGFSIYFHFADGSFNSWGGRETGYGI